MRKYFDQSELTLLVDSVIDSIGSVEQEIVEAEEANAATSVIFALSKDMTSLMMMREHLELIQNNYDTLYTKGMDYKTELEPVGVEE